MTWLGFAFDDYKGGHGHNSVFVKVLVVLRRGLGTLCFRDMGPEDEDQRVRFGIFTSYIILCPAIQQLHLSVEWLVSIVIAAFSRHTSISLSAVTCCDV